MSEKPTYEKSEQRVKELEEQILAIKQSEGTALDGLEEYRTLIHEMHNGFALHEIICDDNGNPCDYRFLEVNLAFERMTGLKREEIIGKTVLDVLPRTEPYWIDTYGRVALTGKSIRFENYSTTILFVSLNSSARSLYR